MISVVLTWQKFSSSLLFWGLEPWKSFGPELFSDLCHVSSLNFVCFQQLLVFQAPSCISNSACVCYRHCILIQWFTCVCISNWSYSLRNLLPAQLSKLNLRIFFPTVYIWNVYLIVKFEIFCLLVLLKISSNNTQLQHAWEKNRSRRRQE